MKNDPLEPPCHLCSGKCCSYFCLELDRPHSIRDFENMKWYLLHQRTMIFVDEGKWFLQVDNPCRYLMENYHCGIYEKRPLICREYGVEDNEICCDHTNGSARHDREYRSAQELERYIRKRFPRSKRTPPRRRAS